MRNTIDDNLNVDLEQENISIAGSNKRLSLIRYQSNDNTTFLCIYVLLALSSYNHGPKDHAWIYATFAVSDQCIQNQD